MMIRHPLLPPGYLTVPEALGIVEARGNINKGRAAEWLSVALRDGAVRVFMRSGEDIFQSRA